jgi:hypothetical protein
LDRGSGRQARSRFPAEIAQDRDGPPLFFKGRRSILRRMPTLDQEMQLGLSDLARRLNKAGVQIFDQKRLGIRDLQWGAILSLRYTIRRIESFSHVEDDKHPQTSARLEPVGERGKEQRYTGQRALIFCESLRTEANASSSIARTIASLSVVSIDWYSSRSGLDSCPSCCPWARVERCWYALVASEIPNPVTPSSLAS